MRRHGCAQKRKAFTLVELAVALVIVSLSLGLVLAAAQKVRAVASRTQCASNLRQLSLAAHAYSSDQSALPPGCAYRPAWGRPGADTPGLSWQTAILAYIEQASLAQQASEAIRNDPHGNDPVHEVVLLTRVGLFLCPTEGRDVGGYPDESKWALTSYRGVAGTGVRLDDGVFHPNFAVRLDDITDGTSCTLLIGERPPGPSGDYGGWYAGWGRGNVCPLAQILPVASDPWTDPRARQCPTGAADFRPGRIDSFCDVNHFWSAHTDGSNFAFADGSVRFLRYSATEVLPALATRAGGEVILDSP